MLIIIQRIKLVKRCECLLVDKIFELDAQKIQKNAHYSGKMKFM